LAAGWDNRQQFEFDGSKRHIIYVEGSVMREDSLLERVTAAAEERQVSQNSLIAVSGMIADLAVIPAQLC
jgi:hypothetical protein